METSKKSNSTISHALLRVNPVRIYKWVGTQSERIVFSSYDLAQKIHNPDLALVQRKEQFKTRRNYWYFSDHLSSLITLHISKDLGKHLPHAHESLIPYAKWYAGIGLTYLSDRTQRIYTAIQRRNQGPLIPNCVSQQAQRVSAVYQTTCCRLSTSLIDCKTTKIGFQTFILDVFKRLAFPSEVKDSLVFQYQEVIVHKLTILVKKLNELRELYTDKSGNPIEAELRLHSQLEEDAMLPPGIAAPRADHVTKENFAEKNKESLDKYLSEVFCPAIVDYLLATPKSFLKNIFWEVEGKAPTSLMLQAFISNVLIKTVSSAHKMRTLILEALNYDTSRFNQEGFGLNAQDDIREIAAQLLHDFSQNQPVDKLKLDFSKFNHPPAPGGKTSLEQEEKLRTESITFITNKFLKDIKGDHISFDQTYYHHILKIFDNIPLLGSSIKFFHGVVQFAYTICTEDKVILNFLSRIAGKDLASKLTHALINIIEIPVGKILILEAMESFRKHLVEVKTNDPRRKYITREQIIQDWCYLINFAVEKIHPEHYGVLHTETIQSFIHKWVREYLNTRKKKDFSEIFEKLMETLEPTIKQELLRSKISNAFHTKGFRFENDENFWSIYFQDYLHQEVVRELRKDPELDQDVDLRLLPVYACTYNSILDHLVTLEPSELIDRVSQIYEEAEKLDLDLEIVDTDSESIVTNFSTGGDSSSPVVVDEDEDMSDFEILEKR
jgi:hypothetical protein